MRNNTSPIVLTALGALLLVGFATADDLRQEQSFTVTKGGTLYLDSDAGSLDIESHDRDTVEVFVEKYGRDADDFSVTFEQRGDDVRIDGDRDGGWYSRLNVRFRIKVPEEYNVDVKTGGGSIDLGNLNGQVNARTSGGSISLGNIQGDVKVKTSGGSIDVEEVAGNIKAHTSGGSVRATLTKQPTADCQLSTSGGSVTAYVKPDIKVDLLAKTSGGRVRSDLPVAGSVGKRSIEGEINGGGPALVLKTSGGSVRVKEI